MKTKVFIDKFKGRDIFSIFEVDDSGNKVSKYPVLSFAGKKAKVLVEHADAISEFAHEQEFVAQSSEEE